MKTFLTLFVLLFSSSVIAESLMLYCSDIKVGGFEGDTNYSELLIYQENKFKIKLDTDKNTITSRDLNMKKPVCDYTPKLVEKYDRFLSCAEFANSITINLVTYKYVRLKGFGFAISNTDDIGVAYGTCEIF